MCADEVNPKAWLWVHPQWGALGSACRKPASNLGQRSAPNGAMMKAMSIFTGLASMPMNGLTSMPITGMAKTSG